jgi:S-adenosylmethionine synthetase
MNYSLFTSESVCAGHPDKICDQISDSILDAALAKYPLSRVAVETLVTKNQVVIAGEVTCPQKLNFEKIARETIKKLGYINPVLGFTYRSPVSIYVNEQSPDIAVGVNTGGAGDQGMMFGYAVDETPELMPLPITLAHALAQRMDALKTKKLKYLRPDGKSEVTVRYEKGRPVGIDHVVLACPHDPQVSKDRVLSDLYRLVVVPVFNSYGYKVQIDQVILNGTGKWAIGGPASDTGVTGRKIIVDSYGGMSKIGGGAFSGKDPTKVDRSAAYAARYIAKNIVAAGLAKRCEVQLAYVIGYRDPITKALDLFGTETKTLSVIEKFAWNLMDLSTQGIINSLHLRRPFYSRTAAYGHFGRKEFPWEKIKLAKL